MSDNAQAGGGTTGTSGSGAGTATLDPAIERAINETINRTIGNRLGRGTMEKMIADGLAKALSGDAINGAVEAAIVKMASSDEPAAAQPAATGAAPSGAQPANDELQQMKAQFTALQKQLADERKQAETRVRESADQARIARVSAHVKATLGDKIKGNPALVELLTKELVRDQKAVDEVDGSFIWRGRQPDGAGGFIDEQKPFDDGFGEWIKSTGKHFIPATPTRLPASGGLPYDGSQSRGAGDPGGVKPTPRMAGVFDQMRRDLGSAATTPNPGGDGTSQ